MEGKLPEHDVEKEKFKGVLESVWRKSSEEVVAERSIKNKENGNRQREKRKGVNKEW